MCSDDDELDVRDIACREARQSLNEQLQVVRGSDEKAIGLFRANLFITGLLLTGFAVTFRNDNGLVAHEFLNIWSGLGLLLLFFSTGFAAVAYTSSAVDVGISPAVLNDVEKSRYDIEELKTDLIQLYGDWLDYNRNVVRFNSYLLTLSIILAFDALVLLSGGVFIGFFKMKLSFMSIILVLATGIALLLTNKIIYTSEELFVEIYSGRR